MSCGDAYVYAVVIETRNAFEAANLYTRYKEKVREANEACASNDLKALDACYHSEDGINALARRIKDLCASNYALVLVATDLHSEPYGELSEKGLSPADVGMFIATYGPKGAWTKGLEPYRGKYLILLNSHYDTDDDLRAQLGRHRISDEDILQEAMESFWQTIRDYYPQRYTLAKPQHIAALKVAARDAFDDYRCINVPRPKDEGDRKL